MTTVTYPFDPTGSNPLCRIVNEQHVLTSLNDTDLYQIVIPSAAPFFTNNLIMTFRNPDQSVRTLVEGIDYYFTHHFIGATKATAKPLAGSITFLDKDITGVLRLTYQTIGGVWTLDDNQIAELLANINNNPRTTAWEQVVQLPFAFPVIDHEWDLVDMVGASEIVDAIQGIRDAVLAGNAGGISAHVADKNNPHEVTKTQVGLASVENYPIATQAQAQGGTNHTTYMTPLRTAQAIAALGGGSVADHAARQDNPHAVTKTQVGLGAVENYGVATNSDAVAGTASNLYMTPTATKAATDVIATSLTSHVNNFLNPHNVSKSQIGLNFVENYPVATAVEAQEGNVNDKYMTPLRVKQAIAVLAAGDLAAHTTDFTNPHNVTKSQVGLGSVDNYATANQAEAEVGTVNNKFMTPLRTAQAISALIGQQFLTHLNASNPHNVTKADVGLGNVLNYAISTQAEAEVGTVNTAYMTPLRTAQAIAVQVGNAVSSHIARTDNPHNVTLEQVGGVSPAQLAAGLSGKMNIGDTAANSNLLEGKNIENITTDVSISVLADLRTLMAPQYRVNTPFNVAAGNTDIWLLLGEHFLDQTAADANGSVQWVISGGGYNSSAEIADLNITLNTYLLSIQLTPNAAGDQILVESHLNYLSKGGPINHSFGYVVDTATSRIRIYMKVPNGHSQLTVTDLNSGDWSFFEPTYHGVTDPLNLVPIVPGWLHHQDPTLVRSSDVAQAVSDSQAFVLNELNNQVTTINNDMVALRDEVTAVLTTMYTAIAGVAPQV